MLKAFAYARYSSELQREESIEAQLMEIHNYADRKGIVIVREYIDRAVTAKTAEGREQFLQMIKDARSKEHEDVSLVLVHKSNRFARNREESAIYKHKLKKSGVRVKAVAQDFGEGPHTVLIEALMEGLDEYYSLELATEIMKGLTQNALKCKFTGGRSLYGYRVNDELYYEIIPEEALVVQRIYKMFTEGQSYADILRYLKSNGIKTRAGKPWAKSALYEMLRNEKYTGVYIFNKKKSRGPNGKRTSRILNEKEKVTRIENGMPAIIPRAWWEKAQEILDSRKKGPCAYRRNYKYLLTGYVFCGVCGGAYVGRTHKNKYGAYGYYACTTKQNRNSCDNPNISQAVTEETVIHYLNDLMELIEPEEFAEKLNRFVNEAHEETMQNKRRIEKALAEIDKKINNLLDAIELGGISEQVKERLGIYNQEKKELIKTLASITMDIQTITPEAVQSVKVKLDPRGKSDMEIRAILHRLKVAATVYPDKRIGISIGSTGCQGSCIKVGVGEADRTLIQLFGDLILSEDKLIF
jgi:site-specific DNA recombinase